MMNTLAQIKAQVTRFAQYIKAPPETLPTFGASADFGRPHIEVRETTYHYIAIERGKEISHSSTTDTDELLYWIFRDITSQMGYSYELAHRDSTRDFRRIAFAHTLNLLERLNPAWKAKREIELIETLGKYPFQDNLNS
jgi:hypothetical protein